jgi:hypothetical protein
LFLSNGYDCFWNLQAVWCTEVLRDIGITKDGHQRAIFKRLQSDIPKLLDGSAYIKMQKKDTNRGNIIVIE